MLIALHFGIVHHGTQQAQSRDGLMGRTGRRVGLIIERIGKSMFLKCMAIFWVLNTFALLI